MIQELAQAPEIQILVSVYLSLSIVAIIRLVAWWNADDTEDSDKIKGQYISYKYNRMANGKDTDSLESIMRTLSYVKTLLTDDDYNQLIEEL